MNCLLVKMQFTNSTVGIFHSRSNNFHSYFSCIKSNFQSKIVLASNMEFKTSNTSNQFSDNQCIPKHYMFNKVYMYIYIPEHTISFICVALIFLLISSIVHISKIVLRFTHRFSGFIDRPFSPQCRYACYIYQKNQFKCKQKW